MTTFPNQTSAAITMSPENHYAEAMFQLEQAEQAGILSPQRVQAVYQHLLAAHRLAPQHKLYLNSMAYLMLLIGKEQMALSYVRVVLELDPSDEHAQLLMETLRETEGALHLYPELVQLEQLELLDLLAPPQSDAEGEMLFTALEKVIAQQNNYLRQLQTGLDPSLSHIQLEAEAETFQILELTKRDLHAKLQFLENNLPIDTFSPQPLEQLHERYYQSLRLNAFFQVLREGLKGTRQDILALLRQNLTQPQA